MRIREALWDGVTSLKLTLLCLGALMVLVVACTLAQVNLGTLGAVETYIRAWAVWWYVPGTDRAIPIFPGGSAVGVVLAANLVAAQARRLQWTAKKAGIWIAHAGLILLVAGEFISGALQVDGQLAVMEGQTVDYVERPREFELALADVTDPAFDDVYGIPATLLARGGVIEVRGEGPGTAIHLRVKGFFENAELWQRGPGDAPTPADRGVGPQIALRPAAPEVRDDRSNQTSAFVEVIAAGEPQGTFLVSAALRGAQGFEAGGRSYALEMRPRREPLPFALTLKDFRHDVYPGTQIPKNFSSLVHLSNRQTGEEREVLISMNQPLRYDGRAFYQASFGEGDRLSILQVVRNPGWLLPYVSCALVSVGLLVHFAISLRRARSKEPAASKVAPAPAPARPALEG
jgi:hypothetical protein